MKYLFRFEPKFVCDFSNEGHIPPSNDCYRAWIHNYIRISERYQHLIVAAYSGHTHKDELLLLYNKDKNNQTIAVALNSIGPSITTFSRLNPGYRIFALNGNVRYFSISILITFLPHFSVYLTDLMINHCLNDR